MLRPEPGTAATLGFVLRYLGLFSDSFTLAIILWPFASAVLTLPILAMLYHKDHRLRLAAGLSAYLAVLYALGLVAFTLYPMPDDPVRFCATHHLLPQLDLLKFIQDAQTGLYGVLQLVMNVVFFMPMGFMLCRWAGWRFWVALPFSFGCSVLIETSQLTGFWGLYPCAYRQFDVDDMLTNTLGAVIGFVIAKLVGLGLITCATSTLYCFAMSVLPASVALTLLFQFTWIGIPIQMLLDHRKPTAAEVLAAVAIVVATVFASGMYRIDLAQLNVLGIVCALAAAVSCATYVTLSGRVTPACPIGQRGLLICLGTSAASLLVCPDFLPSGALVTGMAPYALMAGMFGMFLPALFFSLGTPHLSPASNTILASAELPAGLFIAMVVLAEPVTTLQWVGVGAILLAVAFSQTAPRMRASRA